MLWELNNSIDLYLGISASVVRRIDGELVFRQHAPTMPVDLRLADIGQLLADSRLAPARAHSFWRRRLRVWLGSGFCPLIQFALPEGVSNHHEIFTLARAAAAAQLQMPIEQVLCQTDRRHVGAAGAMPLRLWHQLNSWEGPMNGKLISIRPLWSAATQCSWAREEAVRSMQLEEPDGVTIVRTSDRLIPEDESPSKVTLHIAFSPNATQALPAPSGGPSAFNKLWVRH
ncbi:MAG: hypothetical protein KF740_19950 [Ramlibacter sp.]|nr:hypothetical protein [Ramlibacter sp.]